MPFAEMRWAQDVTLTGDALAARGADQATLFPLNHWTWCWFKSVVGGRNEVNRLLDASRRGIVAQEPFLSV